VRVVTHRSLAVARLEQRAPAAVTRIEDAGVTTVQLSHRRRDGPVARRQHQMEVRVHQADGEAPPPVRLDDSRKANDKRLAILVVAEDRPTVDAVCREVVHGARFVRSLRSRHPITVPTRDRSR